MRKTVPVLYAAVLLLITSVAHSAPQQQEKDHKDHPGKIAAKVNGAPIYEKALNESVALRFNKRKKFGMNTDNIRPNVAYATKIEVLDDLIDSAVIYQATKAAKDLPDVEDQVNQKILSLANTFGSKEDYNKFLNTKNTSLDKKRDYFRNSFLVQAYFDKLGLTNPKIPEEDIKALYEQQKKSFRIPEQAKISMVYLKADKDTTPEQRKKIADKAQQARKMLIGGDKFPAVVKTLSKDPELKVSGGDSGFIKHGTLPKEVDEVAFTIMPWKISDVIESRFGYHVIMTAEKKPASFTRYEKVRDFLLKYLETQTVERNVAAHTKELREKAKIEILLRKEDQAAKNTNKGS